MVHLFHRRIGVDQAAIKGQAQRRYMYGRNTELEEELLGENEGRWSSLPRTISGSTSLPDLMSIGHRDLLYFFALQAWTYALSTAADHRKALARLEDFRLRSYSEIGRIAPAHAELSHEQHVLRSLQINIGAWPYLLDLQPLLILNPDSGAIFWRLLTCIGFSAMAAPL